VKDAAIAQPLAETVAGLTVQRPHHPDQPALKLQSPFNAVIITTPARSQALRGTAYSHADTGRYDITEVVKFSSDYSFAQP
jgi:hypothetical protein